VKTGKLRRMFFRRMTLLLFPSSGALTLALVETLLSRARALQPAVWPLQILFSEPPAASHDWQLPGTLWSEQALACAECLLLLADEPLFAPAPALSGALKQAAQRGALLGGLGAGVYPLAASGLFDGYRVAVHWRFAEDFAERFPAVLPSHHLFVMDRDRLSACGGVATADLLLWLLARDFGTELAGRLAEEWVIERRRSGDELQRVPLQNRLGSTHPKLTQAVILMEANIEEPLSTDDIARLVCVSRRQLERIFKQYLGKVPSQYYLELRLARARQLLLQTSKSIIQIGLSCGFSSGPHFSSAYRNFFNTTPREDRSKRPDYFA